MPRRYGKGAAFTALGQGLSSIGQNIMTMALQRQRDEEEQRRWQAGYDFDVEQARGASRRWSDEMDARERQHTESMGASAAQHRQSLATQLALNDVRPMPPGATLPEGADRMTIEGIGELADYRGIRRAEENRQRMAEIAAGSAESRRQYDDQRRLGSLAAGATGRAIMAGVGGPAAKTFADAERLRFTGRPASPAITMGGPTMPWLPGMIRPAQEAVAAENLPEGVGSVEEYIGMAAPAILQAQGQEALNTLRQQQAGSYTARYGDPEQNELRQQLEATFPTMTGLDTRREDYRELYNERRAALDWMATTGLPPAQAARAFMTQRLPRMAYDPAVVEDLTNWLSIGMR